MPLFFPINFPNIKITKQDGVGNESYMYSKGYMVILPV